MTSSPDTDLRLAPSNYVPGCYPLELEEDITTAAGITLHLRPIRSEDAEKLVAFHARLSTDSIYRRHFSLRPELPAAQVRYFTHVDYVDRLALVIEREGDLVGVGRYDRCLPTSTAEVAFVIRDDYQRLGLGSHLLDAVARAAWARGITELRAVTLPSNRGMMAVFHHSGFPVTTALAYNEISVRFPIDPACKEAVGTPSPKHT